MHAVGRRCVGFLKQRISAQSSAHTLLPNAHSAAGSDGRIRYLVGVSPRARRRRRHRRSLAAVPIFLRMRMRMLVLVVLIVAGNPTQLVAAPCLWNLQRKS